MQTKLPHWCTTPLRVDLLCVWLERIAQFPPLTPHAGDGDGLPGRTCKERLFLASACRHSDPGWLPAFNWLCCASRAGDPGTHHVADFFVPPVLNAWIAEFNCAASAGYFTSYRSQRLLEDISPTLLEGDIAAHVRRLWGEHAHRLVNSPRKSPISKS